MKSMASSACCSKAFNGGHSLSFLPSPTVKAHLPIHVLHFPYALPNFGRNSLKRESPRLGISQRKRTPSEHLFRVPIICCLQEDELGAYMESGESSSSNDSPKGAAIDIKFPRRSLLVKFTCNACGARSQKFVNRLAYERGTVFVQCSGCFQHHKLVDNLGLVVEYDFREEISDPNTNQH